jgi:hypothetical protein
MSSDATLESYARFQKTALTASVRTRWYILRRKNWTFLPET